MSRIISKKNKLIKFIGLSMVVLLLGSYVSISAIDNPYQAGDTLDPNCVPGEVNCTVEIGSGSSQWTTSGDNIYFTGGNVGIGNNNPTSLLDLIINPQIIYEQYFIEDDGNNDSLDDATFSGTYTGDIDNGIQVWVDSEGAPDTFSYSDYNGDCPEVNNIPITGSSQSLCLGMSITFVSTTGHSISDYWYYDVYEGYQNPLTIKDDQDNIHFDLDIDNGTLKLGEYYLPLYSGSNGQVLTNDGNGYVYWDTPSAGSSPISVVGTYGLSTSSWGAGSANYSNFLGRLAGANTSNIHYSNFLGNQAGYQATGAWNSNFLGNYAGNLATNALQSNFMGGYAGYQATNASNSNFFGGSTGYQATNASNSNFLGNQAGYQAANASNSIFIGQNTGLNDTVNNTTDPDDWSILLGYNTNTGGFRNSILLGGSSSSTPISNTKANQFMLAPSITELRWRGVDYTLPSSQGGASTVLTNDGSGGLSWGSVSSSPVISVATNGLATSSWQAGGSNYSNFFGFRAGYNATTTSSASSNFFGNNAGANATNSSFSNFFGYLAGSIAVNASNSNFFGQSAGSSTIGASNSNFFGQSAGSSATHAYQSNFLGYLAGNGATDARNSNFLGSSSGLGATNAEYSNFMGVLSGSNATYASYSNFLGSYSGEGATNSTNSNFIGSYSGWSAEGASNSIFIGQSSGFSDTVNNTGNVNDFSILIGKSTGTGGFSNSIAIGGSAVNTATNQFMIGSTTRPINTTVWKGTSTTATLDTATGLITTSDERLKINIEDLPDNTLDKLLNVRTVNFNWLNGDNDKTNIGFIAQDLEQYFPELVYTNNDENNYKGVNYANMTPILVEAIREMNLKVEEIKAISPVTLGEMLSQFGDSILSNIENGIAYLKDIAVETLRVGSPERRTGITLYDEETGDPYCLSISNGEQKIVSGECSIFEEEEATEEDLPVVEDEGDSDIEDETQGESSAEVDTETPTEEEQPEISTENQTEEQGSTSEEDFSVDPVIDEEPDNAIAL